MDIKKLKEEIHKESYRSDPRSLIDVIDVDTLIDIIDELQAKNNDVLDLVSEMKKPNVHECLNDIMEIVNRRCRLFGEDLGSLRYEFKTAIDKMNCSR